jgi:hypothetical protein
MLLLTVVYTTQEGEVPELLYLDEASGFGQAQEPTRQRCVY